jgi:hypothetical protein
VKNAVLARGEARRVLRRCGCADCEKAEQECKKPGQPGAEEAERLANPTDPDSSIMKTRRGWVQGYNAQLVVTPQQIILASEVTTEANDVRQLQPMLDQVQAMVEILLGGMRSLIARQPPGRPAENVR